MSHQEEITLNSLFDDAYKLLETFDKREDPSNSAEFQVSSRWSRKRQNYQKMPNCFQLHQNTKCSFIYNFLAIGEAMHRNARGFDTPG